MGSKNYTCYIFSDNIVRHFLWNDAVIKSRREADFLLCVWEIHFVWQHYIGHLKELIWVKSKKVVGIRKLRECDTTIRKCIKCCGVN